METNLKIILDEFEKLKGQFVITDTWKVERLVAIGDDSEDWYYVTFDGRDLKWYSCVGRVVQLKNKIDDKDYNEFIRLAKLNHYDQIDKKEFLLAFQAYIKKYDDKHKFLTDFCWDLN